MTFPLFELPIDLIREMINRYFDPISALRCLQVCKKLNELGDRSQIIYNVLRYLTEKEFQDQYSALILCPKCFTKLDSQKILEKHLKKHEATEKRKKAAMPVHNPFRKYQCRQCEGVYSNMTNHTCLMKTKYCENGLTGWIFDWMEPICKQIIWYSCDPNFRDHLCRGRCKFCKEVFYTNCGGQNPERHFNMCPMKKKIIEMYDLRGDRTLEEWSEYLFSKTPETKQKIDNQIKEFEEEYEKWKKENPVPGPKSFTQKAYSIVFVPDYQ